MLYDFAIGLIFNFSKNFQKNSELLFPGSYNSKQDHQALLKAKYCPRVAPVATACSNKVTPSSELRLFLNPGELVQAASCRQERHKKSKTHVILTFDL